MIAPTELPKLSLRLECVQEDLGKTILRLWVRNESTVDLLVPVPKIVDFHFKDAVTGVLAKWYTRRMVSTRGTPVLILHPDEAKGIDYNIRREQSKQEQKLSSEGRWHLGIERGIFQVRHVLTVDHDFFDCGSHWKLPTLEKAADEHNVRLWTGTVYSNELTVEFK